MIPALFVNIDAYLDVKSDIFFPLPVTSEVRKQTGPLTSIRGFFFFISAPTGTRDETCECLRSEPQRIP